MALNPVDLKITINKDTACTDATFTDSTGIYNSVTNPLGYGLPGGIASTEVRLATVVVNMPGGIYFTYRFTIAAGVITVLSVSIQGGTPTTITSYLTSTIFPISNFSLFGDYGVALPSYEDGVITIDYTITGIGGDGEVFSYETTETILVSCDTECCIKKMALEIDPDCDCSHDSIDKYLRASTYLDVAIYNAEIGQYETAQEALDKASDLCSCGGCGC